MGEDRWLTLGGNSSSALTPCSPNAKCDPRIATRLATSLFGCYRASEANDPETFIAAVAATLATYPEPIARQVCDRSGLPSQSKWLPSIAELREACDRAMAPIRAAERREREREHTQQVIAGHKAPVGSPEHRRVVEGCRRLRESMDLNAAVGLEVDLSKLDARRAQTPEARELAVRLHEDRLTKLTADFAAAPPVVKTPALAAYLERMRVVDPVEEF